MRMFTIKSQYDNFPISVFIKINKSAKGVVHILHGMCEHKKRYEDISNFLCDNGYTVIAHDHRGHGSSIINPYDLGYMYKDGDISLIEDVSTVNGYIRQNFKDLPVYILSHSMGTLITRCYLKKYDNTINGCILMGPPSKTKKAILALNSCNTLSLFLRDTYRSEFIEDLIFGKFNLKFILDHPKFGWLTSDKDMIYKFDEDNLCGFTFTLNGFSCLFKLLINAYNLKDWHIKNNILPIHFMAGRNDPCIINEKSFLKSIFFINKLGYINTTYKLYNNTRHELINDHNKTQVYNHILKTLNNFKNIKYKI
ncbi:MAG: alpha/beta fold hydrolase [Oscillospiraceae bacterium]